MFVDKSLNLSKIVSVLRSASVKRFNVSRMRDFFLSLRFISGSFMHREILVSYVLASVGAGAGEVASSGPAH